jgi:hypothetical protein
MAFANLRWKIETLGLRNYQVADAARLSESKFSRALAGRAQLTPTEKLRIAEALGCAHEMDWLFREFAVVPRSYVIRDEPAPAMACSTAERQR